MKSEKEIMKSQLNLDYFSPEMVLNGLVFNRFSRWNTTAYRGESEHSGSGMALLGQGIYSTTDRSYAKKYGKVRTVEAEEMPFNPLWFENILWFQQFEHDLRKKFGEEWLKEKGYAEGVIKSLGYDGVIVGRAKERIICKYPDMQ